MTIEIYSSGAVASKGVDGAQRFVKGRQKRSWKKLRKGLRSAGEFLKRESLKICPIDTGALRKSIRVRTGGRKEHPYLDVSYNMPYAVYVHEDPVPFHPIGQYKFLEQPARYYRDHLVYLVKREFE